MTESGSVRHPAHDERTPSVSANQRAFTDRNLVMTRVTTDDWSAEESADDLPSYFLLLSIEACGIAERNDIFILMPSQ